MLTKSALILSVRTTLIALTLTIVVGAQTKGDSLITWEDSLFAKEVDYGSFACSNGTRDEVDDFFRRYPLKRMLRVCHNNCAILDEFPMRTWPPLDKRLRGNGSIAVHILADADGLPIYARVLNGHPAIAWFVRQRSCEATFKPAETNRQTVLFVCVSEDCEKPQLVYTAVRPKQTSK